MSGTLADGIPQSAPELRPVPPGLRQLLLEQLPGLNTPATDAKSLRKRSGIPSEQPVQNDPIPPGDVSPLLPRRFIPGDPPSQGPTSASAPSLTTTNSVAPSGTEVTALAAASQNAIVLENQKVGNPRSEWDLSGPGASNIEGFSTDISFNLGQTVNFKINTTSNNYRVDIYRLGYYGGDGARKMATLQHQTPAATTQPGPLLDPSTGMVDAGNWGVTDSWALPADAVSGLYVAKLVRQDGTAGANHIPFIVRNDSSTSDIVFQTSDQTWQAYNGWGGANLYGGNGPGRGSAPGRAFSVSYNRPLGTRDGIGLYSGPQDAPFGEEYAALRWMEQNGYDVSYISGVDASRNGALLKNHKIFTSTGHDEYWSGDQRVNVEAARDAGVNLAFMSGNEVCWKTRLAPSIDEASVANRTLVAYKETREGPIDPSAEWTGTWRDLTYSPADAARPENGLTGTLFQVDSYRSDVVSIPYGYTKLRFWRDTGVANTQPGSNASLVRNYLGYEWDESPDNGSRPNGLIQLSSTTLPVTQYLMDYGTTTSSNIATHNLTLYRAPSGALVFGAGTVYWSWGLDANHDLEATPTDPNVQQAMVNLFADMGVQPQTLQASLRLATPSTDQTAPVSTIATPTVGASVGAGRQVTVTGSASDAGGLVAGVEVSTDNGVTWHPAAGSAANWTYTWRTPAPGAYTVKSRAVDDSLNLEAPSPGVAVTVAPSATVSLFQANDVPDIQSVAATNAVELGVKFTASQAGTISAIRFYKGAQNTGAHVGSLWSATGTRLANATFTSETASGWQQVNLASPVSIAAGTTYVASYHTTVGRYSVTPNYFVTPYVSGQLTAPVSGGSTAPNGVFANGGSGTFPTQGLEAATNYWVDVVFNPATSTGNQPPVANNDSGFTTTQGTALTLAAAALLGNDTDPNGDALSITGVSAASNGTVAYNATAQDVTFTPTAGYTGPAGFTYAITDGRGGTASATVALSVGAASTAVSLFSPTFVPSVASDGDTNAVELGVKFTASQAGTISAIRFYKGAQNTGAHVGSLWSATGTRLANATLTSETASGWQQVNLASPVSIAAGTTYVASYHTTVGRYSADANFFSTAHTSGPLTAPASAASGGNGVYAYGGAGSFPTNTFNATNYSVDVVFNPTAPAANQPPVANNDSGFTTTQGTALTLAAAALLGNDIDPNGDPLSITGVSNPTNGTVAYNATTQDVTFTPTAGYTGPAGFTYAITDGRGGTASATVALSVGAAANQPPVANNDSGFTATQNTALTIPASSLLANDTDPNGDPLSITGVSNPTNGTVTYNASTRNVTFTPATGYTGPAGFTYAIADGRGGTASATAALSVNTAANQPPVANNDSGFTARRNTALTIPASSLLRNDTDPNGDPLSITGVSNPTNGTVTYNASTQNVTFTPRSGYTGPAGFTYAITDGRGGTASATAALSVMRSGTTLANAALTSDTEPTTVSLFQASQIPATLSDSDTADASVDIVRNGKVDTILNTGEVRFIDGRMVFDPADPAAQVARLYQAALDRAADQGGLDFWIGNVQAGAPLSALATEFLSSPEFSARFGTSLSNEAFVTRIYQNVLDRAPDAGGLAFFTSNLDSGAATRGDTLVIISESAENQARTAALVQAGIWDRSETAAQVARLYDTVFSRLPDIAGLTGWKAMLTDGTASFTQVTDAFVASPEFQATYGALGTQAFVDLLYTNALGRPGDASGRAFWSDAITNATLTRAGVVLEFSESAEHQARTAANVGGETPDSVGAAANQAFGISATNAVVAASSSRMGADPNDTVAVVSGNTVGSSAMSFLGANGLSQEDETMLTASGESLSALPQMEQQVASNTNSRDGDVLDSRPILTDIIRDGGASSSGGELGAARNELSMAPLVATQAGGSAFSVAMSHGEDNFGLIDSPARHLSLVG